MRGPAYEPSPQVKPVVLSPLGIRVSLCEPYRRSASLSERAVAWLWLNMLNLCKSRREGALGRIDGLAPGEPYGN